MRYPNLREDDYLIIKEPNGSVGASLMMEALPESRMIFLMRDPRDVVASRLDAVKKAQLEAAVSKHSWERIPQSDKGLGKFYRRAQPGGWREDLTPQQISIIEEITAPILSNYYSL